MGLNNDLIKNAAAQKVMSRIALKIDTWENWQKEAAQNLVLHAGEVAFVQVGTVPPMGDSIASGSKTDGVHLNVAPNQILFKVGDGVSKFKDLVWASAIAADVYGWAKQDEAAFKAWLSGDAGFATDLELEGVRSTLAQSIATLTEATTDTTKSDSLASRLAVVEGLAGIGGDGTGALATVEYVDTVKEDLIGDAETVDTIKHAEAAAAAAQSTANQGVANAKTANDWIANHEKVKHITETEMATAIKNADDKVKEDLIGTGTSTITTIKAAADAAAAAQSTANQAKGTAEDAAEWIETHKTNLEKVSADPVTKTEVGTAIGTAKLELIGNAETADTIKYAEAAAAAAQGTANEALGKANTLIGSDTGKSVRTIANEELAAQLIPSNAKDALNELQEIAAWIQSHPDDASAMNLAITELQRVVAGLGTVGEGDDAQAKTVKAYVDEAIAQEVTDRNGAIAAEIEKLDFDEVTVGAGKTLASIKEVNGKIETSAIDIAITKSQVTDFNEDDYATAGHNHDDKYAPLAGYNEHVAKAITTETYLLIDCGSSTVNID